LTNRIILQNIDRVLKVSRGAAQKECRQKGFCTRMTGRGYDSGSCLLQGDKLAGAEGYNFIQIFIFEHTGSLTIVTQNFPHFRNFVSVIIRSVHFLFRV
jgi:hypothetical protein